MMDEGWENLSSSFVILGICHENFKCMKIARAGSNRYFPWQSWLSKYPPSGNKGRSSLPVQKRQLHWSSVGHLLSFSLYILFPFVTKDNIYPSSTPCSAANLHDIAVTTYATPLDSPFVSFSFRSPSKL